MQYHYLKRPVSLIPLAAEAMPVPRTFDELGNPVEGDAPAAKSVYGIRIKRGIFYQPHPAFARDRNGAPRYEGLSRADLRDVYSLSDFKETGTRELIAEDYVYQIKRLAHPRLHSPIFGLISGYIVGLKDWDRSCTLQTKRSRTQATKTPGSIYPDTRWLASTWWTATRTASH